MVFDWTINLGAVFNAILFIVTILGVTFSILRRLDKLEAKVDTIWAWFIRHEPRNTGK